MSVWKWMKYRPVSHSNSQFSEPKKVIPDRYLEQHHQDKLSGDLEGTLSLIQSLLGDNDDFIVRRFLIFGQYEAAILYFLNMIDQDVVNMDVMRPLMSLDNPYSQERMGPEKLKGVLMNEVLYHSKGKLENKISSVIEVILRGETTVIVDGMDEALLIGTTMVEKRSITQPQTEQVIRGAREGFIEQLGTNVSLLRYRLPTSDFTVRSMQVGRVTKSRVAVCYIKGIVNDALVEEVISRISAIDIDGVLDVGYLEQFIEDNHLSPFPQIQNTERPDKAVANLLEGRVIILVDGSPFALIAPSVFTQFYQTTEDYSERFLMVSFIRLARLLALVFSLVTPSLYVAVISFNPELIPTKFAVAVSGGRAGVPFPSIVEVLLMEVSMEVLREATLRLPQQIGGALSIVGVLVIGQAAVAAGFVSPITVVVIALTTIGSFATPAYNAALALRLLRFPLVFLAGMFGLFGVVVGLILIVNHVLSLKSFGVPYMAPVVPGNFEAMKDTVIRGPLWWMKKRPSLLHTPNRNRVGTQVTDHLKQPSHNTLDPLKVGNEKWGDSVGVSASDNNDSGSSHSH
ncbi:spore germination protein [Paenibacillus hexagrammi]|uniref:Spore germination protein n=1 Tax=Paenibacillus hexagrammi TaxID=2908839 RepID=A0ABY3SK47_9BACL|nr:spore germination protein [Paenibacillus sp. YPD9-1]UJF34203.1 spore germination protein [Paenibacillus sp. YPD9-1]